MDRGRAGGYVGNNYVQIQLNKKKRQQHLERIKKIKTRKPGSSATLDNNPPVVIEAMLNDPRKSALRNQYNFVTERENKVLLKRISAILTAPPKITDKDYQDMKRLVVPNTKGFRNMYENGVAMQKNKEFFVHLKAMKPYYKVKEWEIDYQKQLFNQKFMRQVKYTRPPGFVDPLLPPVEESVKKPSDSSNSSEKQENDGMRRSKTVSMITHGGGGNGASLASLGGKSSHVGRVRAVRQDNHNRNGLRNAGRHSQITGFSISGSSSESRGYSERQNKRNDNHFADHRDGNQSGGDDEYGYDDFDDPRSNESDFGGEYYSRGGSGGIKMNVFEGGDGTGEYEHDSFYKEGEDDGNPDQNRVQLAIAHRPIRITDENGSNSLSVDLSTAGNQHIEADIQCWLINQEYVIISATTVERNRAFDAEAEISVADLSVIRGLPPDQTLLTDIPAMEAIAREMVENVELRVDGSASRLVLNLVSDGDDEDAEYQLSDNEGGGGPVAGMTSGTLTLQQGSASLVSEEEIEAMLLADRNQRVLVKGSRLPVAFNVNANAQSIGSITALIELAKRAKRIEHVFVLLTLSSTSDDQMSVVAHFMSSTTFMFKRGSKHRPAVMEGTTIHTTTSLPSVIQADPDMLLTFAENLALNLKVEHDCKTGENELIIVGI